jgi:hypothetical protein
MGERYRQQSPSSTVPTTTPAAQINRIYVIMGQPGQRLEAAPTGGSLRPAVEQDRSHSVRRMPLSDARRATIISPSW